MGSKKGASVGRKPSEYRQGIWLLLLTFMSQVLMERSMVEGGRNLEQEVLETFFEEVERDDEIPEPVQRELQRLEANDQLTDAGEIIEETREALDQCISTE